MTTAAPDPLHEVESFIRRRASTDPEFAQFITALGRWLIQCSQAPSILVEPRPVAEPTLEIEPSRTPEPAFEQSTCELATLIARAPSDAAADADLKGLCDRFNGEVSPRLAPAAGARVVQHAAPPLDRFAALEPMMRRMQLKADACVWARRRDTTGFKSVRGEYGPLLSRVQPLQPCFLWMMNKECGSSRATDWTTLADYFRAGSQILKLIRDFSDFFETRADLLTLACEVQFAIRQAVSAVDARCEDGDQIELFAWCRTEAKRLRIHSAHLSGSCTMPQRTPAVLCANATALALTIRTLRERRKTATSSLNSVASDLKRLASDVSSAPEHGRKSEIPAPRAPSPEVLRVRAALTGKRIVMIGGDERPHARASIEAAFGLGELDWVATKSHASIDDFTAAIAHPNTTIVLLLIRWCSHYYTELQHICNRLGRPFVRLPAGYGANTIANEIIQQAADRLDIK